MRNRILAALFLSATIALGVGVAHAEQTASLGTCVELQNKVRDALTANANSPNYEEAKKEDRNGREFCTNGLYKSGIVHYAHALKLLGVENS